MWQIHHAPQTGLAAPAAPAVPEKVLSEPQSPPVTDTAILGTAALLPAPVTREALQHQRELCVLLAVDLVSLNSKATAQHCNYLARYI